MLGWLVRIFKVNKASKKASKKGNSSFVRLQYKVGNSASFEILRACTVNFVENKLTFKFRGDTYDWALQFGH